MDIRSEHHGGMDWTEIAVFKGACNMKDISLHHGWSLHMEPLECGRESAGNIRTQKEGWHTDISLPCDVHMPLIRDGVIRDPVLADYCYDSEWIEKRSWWFRKTVDSSEFDQDCEVAELFLESLDVNADVFWNGVWLGHHASAFYPFRKDVKEFVCDGENELLIRLTAGLEAVSQADLSEICEAVCTEALNGAPQRGDKRRAFVRKPQYVFGWDWCPRIATCAITGKAYIRCCSGTVIRGVQAETLALEPDATLRIKTEVELLDIVQSADADIVVRISREGKIYSENRLSDVFLRSGTNYITQELSVPNPELWWPNGMGGQPLYRIEICVQCRGQTMEWPAFSYGIRTVRLDLSREDGDNRRFRLEVNGKPMFCKGGDWIPADSIYARVTEEKYEHLLRDAQKAHFNMLRVWGGGIYETDAFYNYCDLYGILIWQDMMFACAALPDHRESFRELVAREADYQTKRLGSRTCLALFCGNNEDYMHLTGPFFSADVRLRPDKQFGLSVAGRILPQYIEKNCPFVPYWNSSPYGGDSPNSECVGDIHQWGFMMNSEMARRIEPSEYDSVQARFVSEYGYIGPCVRESIETYFDGRPIDRQSGVWMHHNNTFEKLTVDAGIRKHYTQRALRLDEYLLYAGMAQSTMLEYSLDSLRSKLFCSGSLFWMYNDCWGEVGWTVVDYYLHRKISYYGVRRAFSPLRLILRQKEKEMVLTGCNDRGEEENLDVQIGWISFADGAEEACRVRATLPPYSRTVLHTFPAGDRDLLTGAFFARANRADVAPAVWKNNDIRGLHLLEQMAEIVRESDDGSDLLVQIHARTYCCCVYLEVNPKYDPEDNYFEMLPNSDKNVRVHGAAGKHFALRILTIGE